MDQPADQDISSQPAEASPEQLSRSRFSTRDGSGVKGFVAGVAAAGIALGFGELIEGMTETIPSLVVAIGEVLVDYTPGDLIAVSISNLGNNQKWVMLTGITVVALLLGGILGDLTVHGRRAIGMGGFGAFGLLGGWATARSPMSPLLGSWLTALLASALGVATLFWLLSRARTAPGSEPRALPATPAIGETRDEAPEAPEIPVATPGCAGRARPDRNRRAFIGWAGGAVAAALALVWTGRRLRGESPAEQARSSIDLATRPSAKNGSSAATPDAASAAQGPTFEQVEARISSLDTIDDVAGISSYLTPNDTFYRIDTALVSPAVDPSTWSLRLTGMVDNPYELTFDEILDMERSHQVIALSCVSNSVGGSLVGNAVWTGVPLTTLLDRAAVQPGADQLVGRSVDDWTAGFPTNLAYDGRNALLAVGMNGEPLPIDHGFPARLVVAGLYGYVSAVKWIEEIRLTTWDGFDGYWVPRGWSKEGPIKTQSRIDVPGNGARVSSGAPTVIAGVAWAPTRGISAVEVRIDGKPWQQCEIADSMSDESWVQWRLQWTPTPGRHRVEVRATDGTGRTQGQEPVAPRPNGAEGWHGIVVRVDSA